MECCFFPKGLGEGEAVVVRYSLKGVHAVALVSVSQWRAVLLVTGVCWRSFVLKENGATEQHSFHLEWVE